MNLKYVERTKKSANGHHRANCFVLNDRKLHFYYDQELMLELAKNILDQLDHHQIYQLVQSLIKNNALRAKRETNVETDLLSCKNPCIANTWEINV
jgi:hypothetical protein